MQWGRFLPHLAKQEDPEEQVLAQGRPVALTRRRTQGLPTPPLPHQSRQVTLTRRRRTQGLLLIPLTREPPRPTRPLRPRLPSSRRLQFHPPRTRSPRSLSPTLPPSRGAVPNPAFTQPAAGTASPLGPPDRLTPQSSNRPLTLADVADGAASTNPTLPTNPVPPPGGLGPTNSGQGAKPVLQPVPHDNTGSIAQTIGHDAKSVAQAIGHGAVAGWKWLVGDDIDKVRGDQGGALRALGNLMDPNTIDPSEVSEDIAVIKANPEPVKSAASLAAMAVPVGDVGTGLRLAGKGIATVGKTAGKGELQQGLGNTGRGNPRSGHARCEWIERRGLQREAGGPPLTPERGSPARRETLPIP